MNALNLGSAEEVERFAAILEEGTAAIARAGHPETRYDLWKIAEDQKGPFGYLFGSIWADREAYEAVHAHPAHQAFMERYGGVLKILVKEEFGNRYRRIGMK